MKIDCSSKHLQSWHVPVPCPAASVLYHSAIGIWGFTVSRVSSMIIFYVLLEKEFVLLYAQVKIKVFGSSVPYLRRDQKVLGIGP